MKTSSCFLRTAEADISAFMASFYDNSRTMAVSNVDNETLWKRFSSDLCDKLPKRYVAYDIWEKCNYFFFLSKIWQFSTIFKKSASHSSASIYEAVFGLHSLLGQQLSTNTKNSLILVLRVTMFARKNAVFQNMQKHDFLIFTPHPLAT